jgi:PAS domain-containing protein
VSLGLPGKTQYGERPQPRRRCASRIGLRRAADRQIDFLNQRWCEYTSLVVDEAYGWGWQAAVHPEDPPELLERWRSILDSGEPCEMEARQQRFDGIAEDPYGRSTP